MALGHNIGTYKMSKISKDISDFKLSHTVKLYLTLENLYNANNSILSLMEKMSLPNVCRTNIAQSFTSSDGQKFNIAVDSLNSNYSFKYHGQYKGSSILNFLD